MPAKAITPPKCNPSPLIRTGTLSDLDAIAAIQAASPEAAQWDPADYLQNDLRVAISGLRIIGFVVTRTPGPGELEILNLAVAPDRRRQGVARALLHASLADFHGDVFLEVRLSNQSAQKFYKSFGFHEFIVRPEYYSSPRETGIVMKFHSC